MAKTQSKNYEEWIKSIVKKHYGKRCPDHVKECACCQAWDIYDTIIDANRGKL
ncbi:hypothetical protein J4458_01360 [Candidatus Woesearchaeota archaeon]|nr:hypothetical protein [Candidatus Woesearchaeota archaeon]